MSLLPAEHTSGIPVILPDAMKPSGHAGQCLSGRVMKAAMA